MCGIAGVVAWDGKFSVHNDVLDRMCDAIAHRGPDGRNVLRCEGAGGAQCGLAFARLAILDLDKRAMQPMTDGRRWLVFNGEIYNFRDLRWELEGIDPHYTWKTTGDSEVILRAFDAWGEACVEHFNGMFAFALWDPRDASIYLARDRMGQKPLYYALRHGRGLAFASEISALRAVPWVSTEIHLASVSEYLQTGYIPAPATIYRGVCKLPPACWLRIGSDGSLTRRSYFDPNEIDSSIRADPAAVKQAVLQAVQRQLVADVPVGCFLSGGIDSSIVAAAVKSVQPDRKLLTFSIGFDDPRYDETAFAAEVASHLQADHRRFIVQPDAANDLPKLASVFGEPFGDSSALPVHYLSRETRSFVKVALSGDGGDELFGGYDRYRAMRWGRRGSTTPRLFQQVAASMPEAHPKSTLAKARRFIAAMGLPPDQRYAHYVALFPPSLAAEIFPLRSEAARDIVAETFRTLDTDRDAAQVALAVDRVTYLPEDLLTKLDRTSMLHALEVRSPFMDHELVRLAAGLATPDLFKGGAKRMLREAFASHLPPSVIRRPKMGFAVPIGQWLRGPMQSMMRDLIFSANSFSKKYFDMAPLRHLLDDHCCQKTDHSQRLYALVMLELWWAGTSRVG